MKARYIVLVTCLCCFCFLAKAQLSLFKTTPTNIENISSREISQVMDIRLNADTYISNNERAVIVKTWDEPKVKISTIVYYKGNSQLTDQQWFERLGITMVNKGNFMDIHSYYPASKYYNPKDKGREKGLFTGSMVLFNRNGDNIGSIDSKRIVTVYVPKWSRLEINVFRTDLYLLNDIAKVEATVTSGSFGAQNIEELMLHATSADFDGGNIGRADVNFQAARFKARNIDDLNITSFASDIIIDKVKKAIIESTEDDYDIDEVGSITGRKWYKTFRIEQLTDHLNINGMNADIKVRNIAPTVDSVNIIDKYGDLRLSLGGLQNYSAKYDGVLSKVFTGFDRPQVMNIKSIDIAKSLRSANLPKPKVDSTDVTSTSKLYGKVILIKNATTIKPGKTNIPERYEKFTVKGGDGTGVQFNVTCNTCSVDFR
ncbi:hypothetical protein ACFGVR_03760 [Mucilaginibacter sp. AW1-3]